MESLNQKERNTGLAKFWAFLMLSLVLLFLSVVFYIKVPYDITPYITENTISKDTLDSSLVNNIRHRLEELAVNQSKINIMLLVDATPGMDPYLPAVAEAAEEIEKAFVCQITAACYRDASEGSWLYMSSDQMGETPANWLRHLSTSVRYDQDEPEAVYYGLREALKSEYLRNGETNLIILVGDAGNHAQEAITQVAPSEIASLLTDKNCHFMAVQTRHPDKSPAYEQFNHQIQEEIILPVTRAYENKPENSPVNVNAQRDAKGTTFQWDSFNHYQIYAADQGQSLAPEELKEKVVSFIYAVTQQVFQRVQTTQDLREGKSLSVDDANYQSLLPYLESHGVSSQQLQYLHAAYQAGYQKNVATEN